MVDEESKIYLKMKFFLLIRHLRCHLLQRRRLTLRLPLCKITNSVFQTDFFNTLTFLVQNKKSTKSNLRHRATNGNFCFIKPYLKPCPVYGAFSIRLWFLPSNCGREPYITRLHSVLIGGCSAVAFALLRKNTCRGTDRTKNGLLDKR